MQEDAALEWMTAWGFALAAVAFAAAASRERASGRIPWFPAGVAAFCLLVALEEISWAQRLLGYRPPVYFLEQNFQQELNVHNLVDTSLRKWALKAVLVGYGVALPLAARVPPVGRFLDKLGVRAPPLGIAPGFAAAAVTYEIYPLRYSGEIVEAMMAFGFLASGLSRPDPVGPSAPRRLPRPGPLLIAALVVVLLGLASGALSARSRNAHPGNLEAARQETAALGTDLRALADADRLPTDCGLHRRVYTWVSRSDGAALYEGSFAALVAQGLPAERADYFLDPWNLPYWVRHRCDSDSQRLFVYSFGPNRRRDSGARALAGDDIGLVLEIVAPPDD